MDAGDDVSDSASMYSVDRSVMSMSARQRAGTGASASKAAAESVKNAKNEEDDEITHRPVSSLKPKVTQGVGCWC